MNRTDTKVDVLLGLQWGDEGKGKIVDVLTPGYDVVARFQGGPNAGHTLEFDARKFILRSVPSGIFQGGTLNVIGSGVALDPLLFRREVEELEASGHALSQRLAISKKAHLILPTHRLVDAACEAAKGEGKIGTTGKGIGPAYMDKVGRNGLRVGDLLHDFDRKYREAVGRHLSLLKGLGADAGAEAELASLEREWLEAAELLKSFELIDSEQVLNRYLAEGKTILAEGAQGTMLDIDFGSYPFVTSSNTICAGCCTGLGVSPHRIGRVYGIFKAYCTRVGSGPFPTELTDETGEAMCRQGHEYGSVTGRRRRCGWIDLVALRYAVMLNGVTQLIMTKADVLDSFEHIKACVAYRTSDGNITTDFPYEADDRLTPVYAELPGWKTSTGKMQSEDEFPEELNNYLSFLEEELELPIKVVSLGADRKQTIFRYTEEDETIG
ncbi:MAG: adenylosuccinate synthase [Tannerellaceae bacterium]|jgi:adenylosuccinate synthase|nr:adenylosuccinate synthase [Tannerellaceae bacterium]